MELKDFLRDSNLIEGYSFVDPQEIEATGEFLRLEQITISDIAVFLSITTGAHGSTGLIRSSHGMNVVVGDHRPPKGGPHIVEKLEKHLEKVNAVPGLGGRWMSRYRSSFKLHCQFESLHPYTDGNGRAGRLIWLWMMGGEQWLEATWDTFLVAWYKCSLQMYERNRNA